MGDSDDDDDNCCSPRQILFSFSILLIIFSNAMLAAGIIIQYYLQIIKNFTNDIMDFAPKIIIIMSIVISAVSILYFISITKKKALCMKFCCALLFMIFIAQIAAGTMVYKKKDEAKNFLLKTNMESALEKYLSDSKAKENWDMLQVNLSCCGIKNYTDWSDFHKSDNLPNSCCSDNDKDCRISKSQVHKIGCYTKIMSDLYYGAIMFGVIISSIYLLEFLCAVYGMYYERNYADSSDDDSESS